MCLLFLRKYRGNTGKRHEEYGKKTRKTGKDTAKIQQKYKRLITVFTDFSLCISPVSMDASCLFWMKGDWGFLFFKPLLCFSCFSGHHSLSSFLIIAIE